MTDEIWTIGRVLQWTEQYFREKGIASARLDGEVLLSHMLKKERIYCYSHYDQPLTKEELAAFKEMILERVRGKCVATITGVKEFMALPFQVNEDVLIPRPDTEVLVEGVLSLFPRNSKFRILDMCVGSGAIIVSILHYAPMATGVGVDISEKALAMAKTNSVALGVEERASFVLSDLFSQVPLNTETGEPNLFDIITANPPYIPSEDISSLAPEVRHEPLLALDGGRDGLDIYRPFLQTAYKYVREGGYVVFEIGQGQDIELLKIIDTIPAYRVNALWKDLGGIVRTIVLQKQG